ncbi:MocR-like transcription factor YczR [Nocardia otitidiscaviarum]|uniref:PLP-dependent aminotransferase family protein n=1 Tax=Nocardia otitidiscaviarum TaxID=1823 RepID=A0A516NVD3_9NOCA|nr:PLP-dependent aminotransferase family protein [Nocardia otitidiscaviarum]MBF6183156.1 PLP-dependent aminotransferase family protein [Nocardia otitidiscaviarum]MCP9622342.1 PLP-dependent aminotransferase family protein [Nocardia otitidiscaviarum]QDP82876.1 PLP-dependent aminotransferase family protein [Nocardia otitidiscaviarum]
MATRVIGAASLARDLGRWRQDEPGARGTEGDGPTESRPGGGESDTARRSPRPAYLALAEGIRLLIHDGRAPLGIALPSERDLATTLGVSRTTVTSAYALLREHGYLISRQGSRSTVALPPTVVHDGTKPARSLLAMMAQPELPTIDMTYAAMSAPQEMKDAYSFALQGLPTYLGTHGMDPVGMLMLREALARRYTERGLPTDPEQILVTLGAQHGLRLLLNVLTTPAERVLIEHPTYPNAIEAIRDVGARPVPVPLLPDGWDLDGIRSAARQTAASVAYLVPDFNNPTGLRLDEAGRAELAAIARDTRMTVIVDESMVDLDLTGGAQTPPAAAFARGAEIVTIGSASKSFWGGLRVGWVRASQSLITKLLGTRSTVDLGTPVMDQLATVHLLQNADAILAQRRAQLRARRATLLEALTEELPDWRPTTEGAGGMSLWVQLPTPVSTALAATAPNHGVLLAAGPRFGVQGAFERFLRLPFTQEEADLRLAVKSIAAAYSALTPHAADPLAPLTPLY